MQRWGPVAQCVAMPGKAADALLTEGSIEGENMLNDARWCASLVQVLVHSPHHKRQLQPPFQY